MIKHLKDLLQGKALPGQTRSSNWAKARATHLIVHSTCAVCGGDQNLEVHHIAPFHVKPTLELEPKNLITLCESKLNGINCHLAIGHLGNYRCANRDVRVDAATWLAKLSGRRLAK